MKELINFQTFSNEGDAAAAADKLINGGIEAIVTKKTTRGDAVFQPGDYADDYILKVAPDNFEKANKILFTITEIDLSNVPANHPLLSLNINELKDVVAKGDEWGADNYALALSLLSNKGITITDEELKQMKHERLLLLAKKKPYNKSLIATAYLLALFPFVLNVVRIYNRSEYLFPGMTWYFPGVLSPLYAWSIFTAKTTLPNGQRVLTYDNASIKHGMRILVANILAWLTNIIILFIIP